MHRNIDLTIATEKIIQGVLVTLNLAEKAELDATDIRRVNIALMGNFDIDFTDYDIRYTHWAMGMYMPLRNATRTDLAAYYDIEYFDIREVFCTMVVCANSTLDALCELHMSHKVETIITCVETRL